MLSGRTLLAKSFEEGITNTYAGRVPSGTRRVFNQQKRFGDQDKITIIKRWLKFVHTLVWQIIFQQEFLPQVQLTMMKSSAPDALTYRKNEDSKHYKENKLSLIHI